MQQENGRCLETAGCSIVKTSCDTVLVTSLLEDIPSEDIVIVIFVV